MRIKSKMEEDFDTHGLWTHYKRSTNTFTWQCLFLWPLEPLSVILTVGPWKIIYISKGLNCMMGGLLFAFQQSALDFNFKGSPPLE